ncbi:hypothetical protein R6Q59_010153 [Mikania micrantha]
MGALCFLYVSFSPSTGQPRRIRVTYGHGGAVKLILVKRCFGGFGVAVVVRGHKAVIVMGFLDLAWCGVILDSVDTAAL